MRITDLMLTTYQIAGNDDGIGILLDATPGYEYENGKRTDTQTHIKYLVVFTDNNFEKITVKVAGTKEVASKELLTQKSGKIKVKLNNLTGKFYRTNSGDYALSCTADSLEML